MSQQIKNAVQAVCEYISLEAQIRSAAKFISPKLVVRATRRGKFRKGDNFEVVLKIGRPNYQEREFIKTCIKAKESFPVKNIQVRFYPKKK